eukprot:2065559-Alexandrium_andersonii.AAC.1
MSASLVGSEMCIRDRQGQGGLGGPPGPPRKAGGVGPCQSQHLPGWPEAVSYTHLTLPTICSV